MVHINITSCALLLACCDLFLLLHIVKNYIYIFIFHLYCVFWSNYFFSHLFLFTYLFFFYLFFLFSNLFTCLPLPIFFHLFFIFSSHYFDVHSYYMQYFTERRVSTFNQWWVSYFIQWWLFVMEIFLLAFLLLNSRKQCRKRCIQLINGTTQLHARPPEIHSSKSSPPWEQSPPHRAHGVTIRPFCHTRRD